ncbi:RAB GTPase homolog H1E [Striga asiatica]|uniref:RAB GTPase homolog H1E n=1 Tax=Striga asiatica TaxID=4170 RepID=A0A5A7P2Y1_STRAF|nr:RAB GTPase homolog H1E [Striga asiatica]
MALSPLAKYKLVFLGDQSVGKTSIITRFMYDKFDANYQFSFRNISNIGYNWHRLSVQDNVPRGLNGSLAALLVNSTGILLDKKDRKSFLNTSKWIQEVRTERGSDVIIVLVGNKTDLVDKRQVSIDEGDTKARQSGLIFIETSARVGFNLKPLFRKIAAALQGMERFTSAKQEDMVEVNLNTISATNSNEQQGEGCACYKLHSTSHKI